MIGVVCVERLGEGGMGGRGKAWNDGYGKGQETAEIESKTGLIIAGQC